MPCYATGSAEGDANLDASEARRQLTTVTSLLCQACELIPQYRMPRALYDWWAEHQKIDLRRRREERNGRMAAKLKREALAKLSVKERKAIGL